MMAETYRKFFDSDVRADPDLTDIAVDWVWNYPGDFEFLVTARELARVTDTLPIAVVRGVLNCMRADPGAARLLPARRALVAVPDDDTPQRAMARQRHPTAPKPPVKIEPPTTLWVPVTTHLPYGVGSGRTAYKLHVVESVRCSYSTVKQSNYKPNKWGRFSWWRFDAHWFCKSRYDHSPWPVLLDDDDDIEDADWCGLCIERATEAGIQLSVENDE